MTDLLAADLVAVPVPSVSPVSSGLSRFPPALGDLIAPRALLPCDRDALNPRRDKRRTELAGHRWAGGRKAL